MSIASIILNGISDTAPVTDKKLVNLDQLMIKKTKDFSGHKYVSQNMQNILSEKTSYHIFNKNDSKNILVNVVYIGNNYFITILNRELYNNICRFSDNYYVKFSETQFRISSIIGYPNHIENNFVITLMQFDNNQADYHEFDVIPPSMYLSYEQPGVSVSYEINGNINNNTLSSINESYITINDNNSFIMGAPLFINNILIGIYYRKSGNICNFYRISGIYSWLNTFALMTKNRALNMPVFVPYTKEQMYNIILDLNQRINVLENIIMERNM